MSAAAGTGNTAPVLTTVTVLLFIWALIAYGIRLYVKVQKSTGWSADDGAMTAAILAASAQASCVCYAIHRGYGNTWQSLTVVDQVPIRLSLYISQILYVLCIGCTKISTGLFVSVVLARDLRSAKIPQVSTLLCTTWTVASVLVVSFRGELGSPWDTMNGSEAMWLRWLVIEILGIALDLFEAAVVWYLISGLQMTTLKKLVVCVILNCRLLQVSHKYLCVTKRLCLHRLAVPIAFRLYYLAPHQTDVREKPEDMITQSIICFVIILASFTCLKPVLRPFDGEAFGSQAARSTFSRFTTEQDAATENTYYELSEVHTKHQSVGDFSKPHIGRLESILQANDKFEDDEVPLNQRGRMVSNENSVVGHSAQVGYIEGSSGDDIKGIRKDSSWSVRAETM